MIGNQISARELNTLISQGLSDSVIIDVRTAPEFERGAIVGAINISVDQIGQQVDRLRNYKNIYFYCLSGARSEMAIAILSAANLSGELFNLTSGLLSWRKEGLSLTSPSK